MELFDDDDANQLAAPTAPFVPERVERRTLDWAAAEFELKTSLRDPSSGVTCDNNRNIVHSYGCGYSNLYSYFYVLVYNYIFISGEP